MSFVPPPCPSDECAASGIIADTEDNILCDVDEDGNIIATVLVSRVYDESGNPGPPSFWDPETGAPYVIMGDLEVCPAEISFGPVTGLELVTRDTEDHVFCDVDAQGNTIAFVLVSRTYDEDGNVTGSIKFRDPFTGDPYVVQGTLEQCCCDEVSISGIVNIRELDCEKDSVTVCQGTDPWIISGDVAVSALTGTLNNGTETAVSGVAVQIIAANPARRKLIVQNVGSVGNVRIGTNGVTATTGVRLTPESSITFMMPYTPSNAIFAIREGALDSIVLAQEII